MMNACEISFRVRSTSTPETQPPLLFENVPEIWQMDPINSLWCGRTQFLLRDGSTVEPIDHSKYGRDCCLQTATSRMLSEKHEMQRLRMLHSPFEAGVASGEHLEHFEHVGLGPRHVPNGLALRSTSQR